MDTTESPHRPCRVCGHAVHHLELEVPDRALPGSIRRIDRCAGCRLLHLRQDDDTDDQRPGPDAFDPHHAGSSSRGLTELAALVIGPLTRRSKTRRIAGFVAPPGPVLELGCGTGELAAGLRRQGYRITAVEPSPSARDHARREHAIDVHETLAAVRGPFRAAILWHVLEHVEDPVVTLGEVADQIAPGDPIIIAVPNAASHDAALFGPAWIAWDAPRHRWHFEPETLERVLNDAGLEMTRLETVPSDTLFTCVASEILDPGARTLTLPLRLLRSVWRALQILLACSRFGPERGSTMLVIATTASTSTDD